MKSETKKRFGKNLDTFFFFLVFAIVIWFFVQFSKQYSEIINIPVTYVNIPLNKFITDQNPESLELRMESSGFKIAWFSLFPPTLKIDVSQTEENNEYLLYRIVDHRVKIQDQLNIDFEESQFLKKIVTIDFERRQEKILPVTSQITVEFAVGYAASDSILLTPDSIKISGPDAILDTLKSLQTVPLTLKKVSADLNGKIAIDTSELQQVSLYQNQVKYSWDVEKFTEGKVSVPVELINVPEAMNVVIFPKQVLLFFQVNLQNFSKVTASDFRVVCDFKKMKENQDFLIPKIEQKPDFVTNIRLNENKIQFIIKR